MSDTPPPMDPKNDAPKTDAPKDDDGTKPAGETLRGFTVDVGQDFDKAFQQLRERASHYLKKGQHTTVRIKFRGKEVATLPLPVLVAAEAATFWWAGPLRLLLVNVVGRSVLEVEFVNEADNVVTTGKQRLLDGELDEAIAKFREAIAMDSKHPGAHLNLGIGMKLKADREGATAAFEKAAELDPNGEVGKEARRQLELLKSRAQY